MKTRRNLFQICLLGALVLLAVRAEGATFYVDVNSANPAPPYADLTNADLRQANLRHVKLEYANLWETQFEGADLTDATFEFAKIDQIANLQKGLNLDPKWLRRPLLANFIIS